MADGRLRAARGRCTTMAPMTTPRPALHDHELSGTYRSADALSGAGQRRTRRLVATELVSLILAGVAGLTSYRVGAQGWDLWALAAALCFALALTCTVIRSVSKPESHWYIGRAGAESVRTLAWRYAVGGEPFPVGAATDEAAVALRYLDRLREILDELSGAGLAAEPVDADELTDPMRALRRSGLAERKDAYRADRIEDQRRWYTRRAGRHERKARWWLTVTCLASGLGLVAAGAKVAGAFDVDLLGVFGACASASIAWNQLAQNRTLVTAYRVAASELGTISARIEHVDADAWAQFVSDSEDAISREHTLWLARRGHAPAHRR